MAMKKACVFIVLLVAVVALTTAQDISLLQNQDIVNREIGCILNRNRCDAIGRQIKVMLPEAVFNNCRRCTPQQAQNANALIAFMQQNYPEEWQQILQMYNRPRNG